MHTQVTCPQCGTPFTAEIHQVIDSDETPELKARLLNGQLNVAICPSCGAGGQMMTPMLFHDATHEMFAIFMPPEMNLGHEQREQIIGQLARQVMDSLPPEKRRAYMLQPQTIINLQTFMEMILETEGITKEMIQRQQKQIELLQTLANADADVTDHLIKERIGEIDETFFAMLQQYIDGAAQAQDDKQIVALTNLRAKLMTGTEIGRQMEKQQIALHGLNREAKAQNGLSPELLLKHLLKHTGDEGIESALAAAGQPALTYQFFQLLTTEIEKREKAGELASAQPLTEMRTRLLKLFDAIQAESQKLLAEAEETLQAILAADDKDAAIQANVARIDDAFMYVLSSRIAQADQQGNAAEAQALNDIH
ncbi:MAG: hypothetical protein GY803_21550, partial [Chloroflexi bacterium]|nr:hypothetical protein [Chloroflexota bacterium]